MIPEVPQDSGHVPQVACFRYQLDLMDPETSGFGLVMETEIPQGGTARIFDYPPLPADMGALGPAFEVKCPIPVEFCNFYDIPSHAGFVIVLRLMWTWFVKPTPIASNAESGRWNPLIVTPCSHTSSDGNSGNSGKSSNPGCTQIVVARSMIGPVSSPRAAAA